MQIRNTPLRCWHVAAHLFTVALACTCAVSESVLCQTAPAAKPKPVPDDFVAPAFSAAKLPGTGVKVDARMSRGSLTISNNSIPTWKVDVTVSNYTASPVQFGQSTSLLVKLPQAEELAGVYVLRETRQASPHVNLFAARYGMLWGVSVDAASAGIWPLGALPGGGGSDANAFLLALSAPWVKPYHPGGGYPSLAPGQQVVFREEILAPFRGDPTYALLMPPSVRESGMNPVQSVFRFELTDSAVKSGSLRPKETKQYLFGDASTAALPSSAAQPAWLRLHALNWLAESRFEASTSLIMRLASEPGTPRQLRNAALLNLGVHKYKPAIPLMLSRVSEAQDTLDRAIAVSALGDAGDPMVAPTIRPLVDQPNAVLARQAMEALGKLRDSASVPSMLGALASGRDDLYGTAVHALTQIANQEAWSGLLAASANTKNQFQARRQIMLEFGRLRYAAAVPTMVGVMSNQSDQDGMRLNALGALENIGGADAWAAIRAACDTNGKTVAQSAVQALARSTDTANTSFVIRLAGTAGHPLRAAAIQQIGSRKLVRAGPVLRAALNDPATPAELISDIVSALAELGARLQPADVASVWSGYQRIKAAYPGDQLATVLIEHKFADTSAVPILIAGLNEEANLLWFSNVRLLKHLTGQTFGPENQYGGDKGTRAAAFDKWRAWWAQRSK
jgi:HEAT repeat protein